jgi:hypothetical protein
MTASTRRAGSLAVEVRLPWSRVTAAIVLAAISVSWAALPLSGGRAGTRVMLIVAIVSGAASVAQLLAGGGGELTEAARGSLIKRTTDYVLTIIRGLPWAEVMVVAVMLLEVLHRSAPWHTGLLGAPLLGYLLAVHLAETRTGVGALRAQLPLIAAGIGLAALAVGIAELPALAGGDLSPVIRVIGATLAVVAGGLGIPLWLGRER